MKKVTVDKDISKKPKNHSIDTPSITPKPSDDELGDHCVKSDAEDTHADEKASGIPKPTFKPVPCYSKPQPSPRHTPHGGF
jgi:hypothetical protein